MITAPAACRECGTIFPSGISVSSPNVVLKDNTSGPCPNCGGIGDVIDGTFDFTGNAIRVKNAPPRTIEILRILQEALAAANRGQPVEEIIEKIAEASPEAARQATTLNSRFGLPGVILLLYLFLQSCSNQNEGKIDWNLMFDQVRTAITGDEPYPGLTSGSTGSKPSEQEIQDRPSRSEETSGPHKPQLNQPQPQPKKQPPDTSVQKSETKKDATSKPPRVKNHRRKQMERASRRATMKGEPDC